MTATYHEGLEQGSEAWINARLGILTASEMKAVVQLEGGGTEIRFRASGNVPEKLTPKRAQALAAIGDRMGTIRELAFLADVSDSLLRSLLSAGALEAVHIPVPISLRPWTDGRDTAHIYDLLAQRVTGYVEPHYQSFDMERGNFDEEYARTKYSETIAPVVECGFVTNDKLGFTIGYSPDGLVGADGLLECKSRIQKWQMKTLIECVPGQTVPADFLIQCQTGLFVADDRSWIDLASFSGGMKMPVIRSHPMPEVQDAIAEAASAFERRIQEKLAIYHEILASDARLVPTERLVYL